MTMRAAPARPRRRTNGGPAFDLPFAGLQPARRERPLPRAGPGARRRRVTQPPSALQTPWRVVTLPLAGLQAAGASATQALGGVLGPLSRHTAQRTSRQAAVPSAVSRALAPAGGPRAVSRAVGGTATPDGRSGDRVQCARRLALDGARIVDAAGEWKALVSAWRHQPRGRSLAPPAQQGRCKPQRGRASTQSRNDRARSGCRIPGRRGLQPGSRT
jgi:hypothetical protein